MSVCATRKTKANPNVYTMVELKKKAIKKGYKSADIKGLDKKGLCKLLKIKWVKSATKTKKSPKTKKVTKKIPKVLEINVWNNRNCNKNFSKKNSTAFTKEELVKYAIKHLKLTKSEASRFSKTQLCYLLKEKGVKPSRRVELEFEMEIESKKKVKKSPKKVKKSPKKVKKSPKKVELEFEMEIETKKKKKSSKKEKKKGDCIERSRLKLKEHQRKLVEYLKDNRGIIAAFDTGTGKTLTAVTASQCYLDANPNGKVIVVTPTSLQKNFRKEIRAYGARSSDERYEFLTMRKFANEYYKKVCGNNVFLIIDEAHNLKKNIYGKGVGSKKSAKISKKPEIVAAKVAINCAKNADKVLLLTATPLLNSPKDLINLAAMVKGTDPLTQTEFERMYPAQMCEYFRNMIMYFENPKTEDFPERIDHPPLRMIMSKEYYRKYREVETKKSSLWKDSNPWIFLTGVRVATNALEPCQKCEWTINKIKEGEKTLVYSAFLTYGVKKLQEMLKNTGIKFEEVIGSMSPKERAKAVRKYNKGAKNGGVNVLFITKAGGEGLDLKGTRNVILLEKSWNKPQEEQIIGRAVRYKSHSDLPKDQQKVDVYHLLISKPANGRDVDDDKRESADDILNELTEDKEAANKMFQKLLRSVSIDAPKGSVCPPVDYIKINSPKTKKKQGNKIKMTVTIFDKRKFFGRKKLHENEKIKEKLKNIILKSDKNVNPDEDIIYKTELLPGFTEEDRIKMGTGAITQNIIKFTMYGTKKSISAITKRIVKLIAGSSTLKNYFNEDWKNDNTLEYTIEFAHHHGISPKKIILSKSPIKIISPKKAPKSFTKTYSKSSEKSPIEMELEYPKKGNKTKMFVTIYDERPYLMNIPPSARGEHAARKFLDKKMIEQIKDIILKSDKKVNVDEDIDYEEELSQNVIGFTMYGTKNTTQDVTMKIGKLIAGFRGISNFDWENKNTLVYTIK